MIGWGLGIGDLGLGRKVQFPIANPQKFKYLN